jgi:hypothetical protein
LELAALVLQAHHMTMDGLYNRILNGEGARMHDKKSIDYTAYVM